MTRRLDRYRLAHSLEPQHPLSTYSHPAFEAVDVTTLERRVVKFLFLDFPLRPQSVERYLATMRDVQALRAPSLVPVVDAGVADGEPWYAMAFVAGETLEASLQRGRRFSTAETAAVIADSAAAVTAAHGGGLGGMGLQPRHVLLARDGARVWDVGVDGWLAWARTLVAGQYTAAGQIQWVPDLTPDEMAGRPLGGRSEAGGLALIAFRMLAGRYYWHAVNESARLARHADLNQLLMEVMGAIEPPQARADIALPRGFDDWFVGCLRGDVADAASAARWFPR